MGYRFGKNVFITGGSSGIGLSTAELLAGRGYIVYAASRNPSSDIRRFPGGGEIHPVQIDVRDPLSVESAADAVLSKADIGIVVHCAGNGIACPAEHFPAEAVAALIEANYCGVMRVNSKFLPHMRERGGGLCVIVGSVAGVFPVPFQSHYCSSKAALDLYAATLRMELREHGVKVCLIMPGDTKTGFTDARSYEVDETSPYYHACLEAVHKMEKDELGGKPPITVARAILMLCDRKNPPLRTVIGFDYKLLVFLRRLLPDRMAEAILMSMYMGKRK